MSKDSSEGAEIDREVAEKVMGWPIHSHGPMSAYLVGPDRVRWPSDWSPSTRIDHAWEVVEKLRNDGFWVYIWWAPETSDPGKVHCKLERRQINSEASDKGSAPLAICRAALQAVNDQPQ